MRSISTIAGLLLVILTFAPQALGQDDEPALERYVGEVTGNNVYVRSGPDGNYYPVTKLNTADRVVVVGEKFGWLEIVPPAGCFSLIDKNFIDRGTGDLGVVNGDLVWVNAGSELSDRRYARQLKLPKGAEVKILGEAEAGYYKIAPPQGAHLWIFGQFVRRVPGVVVMPGEVPRRTEAITEPGPTTQPGRPTTAEVVSVRQTQPTTQPVKPKKSDKYTRLLAAIEQDIVTEFKKPPAVRRLQPFIKRLAPVAKQDEEEIPRLLAAAWIERLERHIATMQDLRVVQEERARAEEVARRAEAEREAIRKAALREERKPFDAQGEFRRSYAFAQRFRLVDTSMSPPRTVAYIEIPRGSPIDPEAYIGRTVGVRADSKTPLRDTVDPICVIVPSEIVVIRELEETGQPVEPTTQPAETASELSATEPNEGTGTE